MARSAVDTQNCSLGSSGAAPRLRASMRSWSACRSTGERSTSWSKYALATTQTMRSVSAITVAERRSPVRSAPSPTTLPAPTRIGSTPGRSTRAVPDSMK